MNRILNRRDVVLADPTLTAIERDAAARAARRMMDQAREALPPELAYLSEGLMAEAIVKAVEFARSSVSETTAKIYEDDWNAFTAWCAKRKAPFAAGAAGRGDVVSGRVFEPDGPQRAESGSGGDRVLSSPLGPSLGFRRSSHFTRNP